MRGTPARRSSERESAAGSGGTRSRITRRVGAAARRARRRSAVDVGADRPARARGSIHGGAPDDDRRRRRAGAPPPARPRGPHSSVTRSAPAATARIAGPASSTSPSLSRRATRTWRHARPPQQPASTAGASSVGRAARAPRATSSGRVARASGRARRARRPPRGLDVGADVADDHAALRIDAERARRPRGRGRARGLRQSQPSSGPCGQTAHGPSGPSSASTRALTAATCRRVEQAARDRRSGWRRRRGGTPGGAQPVERRARAGHRLDQRRVAVVGDVDDERAVAVEQDGVGTTRPAAGAAGPRARSRRARARAAAGAGRRRGRGGTRAGHGHREPPRRACAARARSARHGEPRGAARASRPPPRRPRGGAPGSAGEDGAQRASAVVARWLRSARAGRPPRSRQPRPCSARISASSALPACLRERDPARRRADRVHDRAAPALDAPARRRVSAQAEVGVLAVGAREALVEAADARPARCAGRRGRPSSSARVSRPATLRSQSVGRRPAGSGTRIRPWHAGHVARRAARGRAARAARQPPAGMHVVVEEHDPLRRARAPARVARRGRPVAAGAQERDAVRNAKGRSVAAVVDHDDPLGARGHDPLEERAERRTAGGRNDDVEARRGARRSQGQRAVSFR